MRTPHDVQFQLEIAPCPQPQSPCAGRAFEPSNALFMRASADSDRPVRMAFSMLIAGRTSASATHRFRMGWSFACGFMRVAPRFVRPIFESGVTRGFFHSSLLDLRRPFAVGKRPRSLHPYVHAAAAASFFTYSPYASPLVDCPATPATSSPGSRKHPEFQGALPLEQPLLLEPLRAQAEHLLVHLGAQPLPDHREARMLGVLFVEFVVQEAPNRQRDRATCRDPRWLGRF